MKKQQNRKSSGSTRNAQKDREKERDREKEKEKEKEKKIRNFSSYSTPNSPSRKSSIKDKKDQISPFGFDRRFSTGRIWCRIT